jgi:uncharacterized protein
MSPRLRLDPTQQLYVFTFVSHLVPGWTLASLCAASGVWALAVLFALVWSALLRGRLRLVFNDRPTSSRRALLERAYFAEWTGAAACSLLAGPAVGLFVLLEQPWINALPVALGGYGVGLFAVFFRARRVVVRNEAVFVPTLPAEFDGYRIVHLSDLHVGSLFRGVRVRELTARVNELRPDLVALTGDYVTTGNRFHREVAEALGSLSARDGVLAVLGNHDNFGEREPLLSAFAEVGIRVLHNEPALIQRQGAELCVVGIDDTYTRKADVELALQRAQRVPELALVHDPRVFDDLAARDIPLVLAGHTHWGQIGVPLLSRSLNLGRLIFKQRTVAASVGASQLLVHPGIGTTGLPIRFGVAPAICVVELRCQAPTAADESRKAPSERKRS